jgi:NAD(P)-dependent dehydrogenase (short-subunit alcohol dehydrogenase family)
MSSVLQDENTAVVTGASSGIGRAAALDFASKGMNVWLVDVDAEELELARKLVVAAKKNKSTQLVEARVVDVSDCAAMEELAKEVFEKSKAVHFLMNNAGIGSGGGALETDMATVQKVMGVNTYGPIHGCLAFVPKMKKQGSQSVVVNTGSKQGITMPPGNLTYNMSKAALKCYTEGLCHELMGTSVSAALLIPGWVNTSIALKSMREKAGDDFDVNSVFFHEAKPASSAWMPQQVIDFMISELDKGRFYIVCPDNDVDRTTDNLRMTWTMQDITEDRQPLSRWHPDYKEQFAAFLKENGK